MTTEGKVEQIDRDAAADYWIGSAPLAFIEETRRGEYDEDDVSLSRAFACHRLAERAAIVAWLRTLAGPLPPDAPTHGEVWVLNRAADAIEQGRHHDYEPKTTEERK